MISVVKGIIVVKAIDINGVKIPATQAGLELFQKMIDEGEMDWILTNREIEVFELRDGVKFKAVRSWEEVVE